MKNAICFNNAKQRLREETVEVYIKEENRLMEWDERIHEIISVSVKMRKRVGFCGKGR